MKIGSTIASACAALYLVVSAPTQGAAQALISPVSRSSALPHQLSRESTWLERTTPSEPDALRRFLSADSTAHSHRRAAIVGGAIGAVVVGLASTAYILNATAYRCTTVGSCPHDLDTGQRVIVITAGTVTGAALGAWIGHRISKWRSN